MFWQPRVLLPLRPLGDLAILGLLILLSGCYHVRVTAPDPNPATEYEQRTTHGLFWGLVQRDTRAINCQSNALDEVEVTTNLGYLVLSVATLGIWVPMRVRWKCAKDPLQEGDPLGARMRLEQSRAGPHGASARRAIE